MGRAYRRLRGGGQHLPPFDVHTLEFLQWGLCLLATPTPFDPAQARPAWEAYREHVLDAWQAFWAPHGVLPACWAERALDGAEQVPTEGLSPWVRERIGEVEAAVSASG
jgi:hypothetical protein